MYMTQDIEPSPKQTEDTVGPPPVTPRQQQWAERLFRRAGWRLDIAPQAYEHPKYVLIGAFHTSNWDGVWAALGLMAANIRTAIIIKDDWVKKPVLGPLITSLGGVGVDRSSGHGTVRQIVDEYNNRPQFVIGITPEGTRGPVEYWKSGFYLIAKLARVPLLLGYLDYSSRTFGIAPVVVQPSGNLEADMQAFVPVLDAIHPKFPENRGVMRFRP
jgi:1-acyl-sn-glycerol-3-phosphate acyltransferase